MRSTPVALVLLPLFGCSPGSPASPQGPPPVQDSPYYPLKVGTVWTYHGAGPERVMRVARHELVEGTPCAVVETLQDREVKAEEYIFARADGIYGFEAGGQKQSAAQPILKLPPTPGRTWNVKFNRDGRVSRGSYTIGPVEEVTVPAGKYAAVPLRGELYEGGVRRLAFTYWFAAGVGVVKQHVKSTSQSVDYDLVSFEQPP